ncbi:hypothetical protein N24_0458 [Corynebacterium suranareeae]|uniref:Uncharacterized protein n=1 Tax=Corynebacterium suranareeae TaxID=2506452 RepID=A0A160PR18_9CORY|nr:hypothetical protein [Corynebacterium suranareeae]BAU94720.1 hypothetical protein N24_0458 [Corynebacterium suranareeae]
MDEKEVLSRLSKDTGWSFKQATLLDNGVWVGWPNNDMTGSAPALLHLDGTVEALSSSPLDWPDYLLEHVENLED